jgi:hypothetical protein
MHFTNAFWFPPKKNPEKRREKCTKKCEKNANRSVSHTSTSKHTFPKTQKIYTLITHTGGRGFCPGKLTLGKILPGKNSVPELKNGGRNSVPSGFGRVKRKFGAKRQRNFWHIF